MQLHGGYQEAAGLRSLPGAGITDSLTHGLPGSAKATDRTCITRTREGRRQRLSWPLCRRATHLTFSL